MKRPLKWSWWATEISAPDEVPETYHMNEASRETVIAAARREFGEHAGIAIVEATQDGAFDNRPFDEDGDCPLIEAIFECWCDKNGDRWGEGDGAPIGLIVEDVARRLNDAFEAAIGEHHETLMEGAWTFTAQRNFEIIAPEVQS